MNAVPEQPTVSVVIPAHNAEKTLERLLDTVTNQTWKALEIILVNDGSTDGTEKTAREAAEKDARIAVITQENRGVSAARNAGLALCTGKYIRFADADDTLPHTSIEIMVRRAEKDRSELVIGGFNQYIGDRHSERNLAGRDDTVPFEAIMKHLCSHANSYFYGVLWNKLFLHSTVKEAEAAFQENLTWGEDFAFVMDCMKRVNTVSFMKEALYDYRRTASSASVKQVFDCVVHPMGNIRVKQELYSHLKAMYVSRGQYEKYRRRLWHYLFRVGIG